MNRTLLACLIIALFVVVGIQGFYLYRLTERLDVSTHLETEQTEFLSNGRLDPDPQSFPDPWDEMRRMQDRINRLFNNTFAHLDPEQPFNELFRDRDISPSLDLRDAGDRYILKLDLPGAEESQIDVTIENDRTLIVEAVTRDSRESTGRILHRERHIGQFRRRLTLPEAVESTSMKSNYEDGVLTLNIKKKSAIG